MAACLLPYKPDLIGKQTTESFGLENFYFVIGEFKLMPNAEKQVMV